jgi:hypothetical protein
MVGSALRQHNRLTQNSVLHQRYEVEQAPEPVAAPSSVALIERVRTLRSWAKRWV